MTTIHLWKYERQTGVQLKRADEKSNITESVAEVEIKLKGGESFTAINIGYNAAKHITFIGTADASPGGPFFCPSVLDPEKWKLQTDPLRDCMRLLFPVEGSEYGWSIEVPAGLKTIEGEDPPGGVVGMTGLTLYLDFNRMSECIGFRVLDCSVLLGSPLDYKVSTVVFTHPSPCELPRGTPLDYKISATVAACTRENE